MSFSLNDSFPQSLIYKGKPIDPLCFYQTGESQDSDAINLTKCGLHTEQGRSLKGENNHLTDQGYLGYDFSWDMDNGPEMQGYSYYKPLGSVNQSILIQTVNNGGGTGEFTTLSLVKRHGNELTMKTLAAGDRCNNGVDTASIVKANEENKVVYAVKITPFDFISLSNDNPNSITAYDDLDACAACCLGVAVFSRDFNDINQEKLNYIDLTGVSISVDDANSVNGVKYQQCFNQVLLNVIKEKGHKLDQQTLKQFVKTFNQTCIKR